jgi:hypothetical protein
MAKGDRYLILTSIVVTVISIVVTLVTLLVH